MAIQVQPTTGRLVRDRVGLLGTRVDRVGLDAVDTWIEAFIESGKPHQIVTANLDFIAVARKRPAFAKVIEDADLVLCDGKPLQWAASIQGSPISSRVTGMDLVVHTARLSSMRGYRIFLLGAAPGVADRAAQQLKDWLPDCQIVGAYSPRADEFDDEGNAHMVATIRAARPDALFVALGAPKQDEWINQHLQALGVPLCAGIGGVFNFLAGETRRAPTWMQHAGFEWAFRLMQEPSRLWRRYLLNDLPIFFELFARQIGRRGTMAPADVGYLDEASVQAALDALENPSGGPWRLMVRAHRRTNLSARTRRRVRRQAVYAKQRLRERVPQRLLSRASA